MIEDPNKPIIDTRTTVVGNQPPIGTPKYDSLKAVDANPAGSGAAPAQTQAGSSASSSSVNTGVASTGAISTTIPDEFKGSSNQELIDYLERKIREHKPLSDADLAKIRRRQKAEGIISGISDAVMSVANLVAAHNYAPNMYNASEGMSAKARARFDKEKAEREAEDDKYFNYAITLGRLRDADKARGLQAWQTEQTLARQDRAYKAGRQDRQDDIDFRNKDFDTRINQWQQNFDRQGEWHKEEVDRWKRQFIESVRQFNVSSANEWARINAEAEHLAQSIKEKQMTFNLGPDNGNVTLTLDKLNAQTISSIYNTLPAEVRSKVGGDPIYAADFDDEGKQKYDYMNGKPLQKIIGYRPSTEAMLIAIGANVAGSAETQKAIREVAGTQNKGTMPGVK